MKAWTEAIVARALIVIAAAVYLGQRGILDRSCWTGVAGIAQIAAAVLSIA